MPTYSYSRISTFDKCPLKYYYKYILKFEIPDNDNFVFEKGKYLHELLQYFPVIPEYDFKYNINKEKKDDYIQMVHRLCRLDRKFQFLFDKKIMLHRENTFYLDKQLNNHNDKDDDCLFYGLIDYVGQYANQIMIVDWKSGKTQRHASFQQLKLYSIWAFNEYPKINSINACLFFIEQNEQHVQKIKRSELESIKQELFDKINTIESTTDFKKKVCEDCQYCDYRHDCKPFNIKK